MQAKPCRDCVAEGVVTKRPAPHPGPRCSTHHRAVRRARRTAGKAARVEKTYGISAELQERIRAKQGGVCAICGPRTGRSGKYRALATDHDHSCCDGPTSCGKCVRGFLCGTCNKILGWWHDDVDTFLRAVDYLRDPPAREILRAAEELRAADVRHLQDS